MATLHIIQGFIASGKSTFSKQLSAKTNATILNPDEWVKKLYSQTEYMQNWNECFDNTVNILWKKAKELLEQNVDVIFDMGFWLKKDRDFARKFAKECNAIIKHYDLDVPVEILKERIIASRPPEWAKRHLENYDKNKSLFQPPTQDEDVIVINNF